MIHLSKKNAAPVPPVLLTRGVEACDDLKGRYDNEEREFGSQDFHNSIYGHTDVKDALRQLQDGKCAFCESKVDHISHGDVEHYRPKAGWVQTNEPINKPGYYWLTYEWSNLLFCCQLCNQRHKRNFFPLLNPDERVSSHHGNIDIESPVFIHPGNENPEDFIGFNQEIPVGIDVNERGLNTIKMLGLDRPTLNERRREKLALVRDIYDLAKGYPETPQKDTARTVVRKYEVDSQHDTTEYASMLRSFFRNNPVDF